MSVSTPVPENMGLRTPFAIALVVNFIWINISEVFRYFAFIIPMMRDAFSFVPDVAPMNLPVFLIWGVWDTILVLTATIVPWAAMNIMGASMRNAILSGTGVWLAVFVILWLGLFNMNLATVEVLAIALPLAWLEMVIASLVVWFCVFRSSEINA
jgi:hypothetical protein